MDKPYEKDFHNIDDVVEIRRLRSLTWQAQSELAIITNGLLHEVDRLTRLLSHEMGALNAVNNERDRLRAAEVTRAMEAVEYEDTIKRLRAALERYGVHDHGRVGTDGKCPQWYGEGACTCGLSEALRGVRIDAGLAPVDSPASTKVNADETSAVRHEFGCWKLHSPSGQGKCNCGAENGGAATGHTQSNGGAATGHTQSAVRCPMFAEVGDIRARCKLDAAHEGEHTFQGQHR